MGDATQSPIASKAQECVGLFEALAELSSSWDDSPAHGIEQREVLEHLGQFRIWAGNIGALQPRSVPSSLEHRLRDAPKFAAEVMSLLGDLVDILEDVFAIASGEREGRVDDSDSSISDSSTAAAAAAAADGSSSATTVEQHGTLVGEELEELSEIQELLRSIPEMISMLFKLSVIIRSSSSRDRFAKAQMVSSRAAVDPSYDIGYVKDKFPTLKSEGMDWLATRLGTAIAQRRQFMWYCRDHRDKMAKADADDARGSRSRGAREADVDRILNIRSNRENAASLEVKSQFSKPASTQAPTTASTVIPGKLDSEVLLDTLKVDSSDADSQSVTSYASSVGESDEAPVLSVIPLEDVAAPRANFECPYCWTIQKFNNQKAWKKHVMTDLKPYICTAAECDMKLFPDHRIWFAHGMQNHWVHWQCCFCPHAPFDQLRSFRLHIAKSHGMQLTDDQFESFSQPCKRSMDKLLPSACQICDTWSEALQSINSHLGEGETLVVTPQQLSRHMRGHMEQMALFAISRDAPEDGAGESDRVVPGGGSLSTSDRTSTPSAEDPEDIDKSGAFYSSVSKMSVEEVGVLLEAPEFREEYGITEELLVAAVANRNHGDKIVELLLQFDEVEDYITTRVIQVAAANETQGLEMVKRLLGSKHESGVTIDSAIMEAACDNFRSGEDMLELFFQYRSTHGQGSENVLLDAAISGHHALVRTCLQMQPGLGIDYTSSNGETPLITAVGHQGDEVMAQLLLEGGASINAQDKVGQTALCHAARRGHLALVRLLLEFGADVNAGAPLQDAIVSGDDACIDALLAAGADVNNASDKRGGKTSLMAAAGAGQYHLVERLIELGANINAQDNEGRTALIEATRAGKSHLVEYLIQLGVNINTQDNEGRTALIEATRAGESHIIKQLIKLGANINAQDNEGRTALMEATRAGDSYIVERLIEEGGDIGIQNHKGHTCLWSAIEIDNTDILQQLLEAGADVNHLDSRGRTPLAFAVSEANVAAIEVLLDNGGDPEARDEDGRTPVSAACERGYTHILNRLEQATGQDLSTSARASSGADKERRGQEGPRTPPPPEDFTLGDLKLDALDPAFKHVSHTWKVIFNPRMSRAFEIDLLQTIQHDSVVCCVSISKDGTYVATGSNRVARIHDIRTGENICDLEVSTAVDPMGGSDLYVRGVSFSPDGRLLATGSEDHLVRLWDIESQLCQNLLSGHEQDIYNLEFSPDGHFLASGSADRTVRIWNVSQGSSIRTICFDEIITNIRFSAAPPFPLAVGTLDNAWSVVDASSGLKTHQADDSAASNGHKDSVYSVDFSPDGKHLFSASLDRTVKMWELGSSSSSSSEAHKVSCSRTFTGHKDFVLDVTLTPDGKWLLSASKDRGVMIWDVETGVPHALLQGHKNSVIRIDVSPDGQYIATASGDMSVRIWSISTITPN